MARGTNIWTNFTSGELSPRLEGRVDWENYFSGAHVLENVVVHPHGGATRRAGTKYIATAKDSTYAIRLVPFVFSDDQAYILELGDQYMRFYYDQGQIVTLGATLATHGAFTSATGWTLGTGWTIAGGQAVCSGTQTADTDLSQVIAFTPGSTYQVAWTLACYTDGTIRAIVAGRSGPYHAEASPIVEYITPATSVGGLIFRGDADFTGAIDNVTVKVATPYELATPWTAAQTADLKFAQNADVMYFTHPNVEIRKLSRLGHTSWTLATVGWTAATAGWTGATWPGSVAFFEQRLWFAGTPAAPQTIWASMTNDYENFTTGGTDDYGLVYTIASDRIDRIRWLLPQKRLVVGTIGSEWTAGAASTNESITPTNVRFERETTYGSANVQARLINNAVLFVGPHGKRLMELTYDYQADRLAGRDLTLYAEHLSLDGISAFDYAQDPDNIVWAIVDGDLLSCTYYPPEKVLAWARHTTGGTNGEFESVAVIPGYDRDETWVAVKRTIDGSDYRYIELLGTPVMGTLGDVFFVDSALQYTGGPTTHVSGLDHLEGKEVQVLTDGANHSPKTVSGGEITLERAAEEIDVGLGYDSLIVTNRANFGSQDGTSQGKKQRSHAVVVRFYLTIGALAGTDQYGDLDRIPFRTASDPMDEAVPLFNGDKMIRVPSNWEREARIVVKQDQPLPMTVLAIIHQMVTEDL